MIKIFILITVLSFSPSVVGYGTMPNYLPTNYKFSTLEAVKSKIYELKSVQGLDFKYKVYEVEIKTEEKYFGLNGDLAIGVNLKVEPLIKEITVEELK